MTSHASITPIPSTQPKRICILGSTGTIGENSIALIREKPERYQVEALTARKNVELLIEQARTLNPKRAVIEDDNLYNTLKEGLADTETEAASGTDAIIEAATLPCDLLISAIVGAAALAPTLAAIQQGTTIGLANKECLVCGGDLITDEVNAHDAFLLPIDSEHNAAFQVFDFDHPDRIETLTLTASGGPFRNSSLEQMASVTPDEAVAHPNWKMGAKISVDSATMMNKGLEVIEAYYLFPLEKDQIDIIIHPESIVHALVSYRDGSVAAGLSEPDMRVPLAFALGWPDRIPTQTKRLDLASIGSLTFESPDNQKFPAISLAREVLVTGGTAPTILNAANEVAVQHFIDGSIGFLDIVGVVAETLVQMEQTSMQSLEQVLRVDQEARVIAGQIINNLSR